MVTDELIYTKDIKPVLTYCIMLLETKKSTYFYQCSGLESVEQVREIGSFLKNRVKDPYLRFCIGVYFDSSMIDDSKSLKRVKKIFQATQSYPLLTPILHYSFKLSENPINELTRLREVLPDIRYIQLNDLHQDELKVLMFACRSWRVDFPLNNKNFDLVHNEEFTDTIISQEVIILLDNSRGRGIRENKEQYLQKIRVLLDKGVTRIALCGGFSANNLDTYFEISRIYSIPFSIDAESRLKTNGKTDTRKIKRYFTRLIEYNNIQPKHRYLEGTANLLKKEEKIIKPYYTYMGKNRFVIFPRVFNPDIFFSSRWFASKISEIVKKEQDFLEIGCGTGIVSITASLANQNLTVVASDISKDAVDNTRENIRLHHIHNRVSVFLGDVFQGIKSLNRRFDTIFWALPFGYLEPDSSISLFELQVNDPGYRSIRKFFAEAPEFLKPLGKLLIGFSSDIGHLDLLEKIAKEYRFELKILEKCKGTEKEEVSMEIWEARIE